MEAMTATIEPTTAGMGAMTATIEPTTAGMGAMTATIDPTIAAIEPIPAVIDSTCAPLQLASPCAALMAPPEEAEVPADDPTAPPRPIKEMSPRMIGPWLSASVETKGEKLTLEMWKHKAASGQTNAVVAAEFGMTEAAFDQRIARFEAVGRCMVVGHAPLCRL
jgi:hypothetical protein